ncbi:hypothetical protein [Okeania sp. KiyG1]|uniref:hypothetical protein n=1 Tax=Okeania sp. KiyG1 TaxID=2720165 RepID=UPI0019224BD9|nr:hypothetical protein [Okeania sp. KiyG1]GFZ97994.1 hypothetical protein CYANOKiyG1_09280 [Okeania sp. KiyG1]
MNNEKEKIDWGRLQKALSVEVQYRFQNIQGKQYIFNEFINYIDKWVSSKKAK